MSLRPPVHFQHEYIDFAEQVREFSVPYADQYLQMAHAEAFPWDMAKAMGEAGLLGLGIGSEFGGAGRVGEQVTYTHFGMVQEELAYANFYLAQLSYSAGIMGPLLDRFLESPDKAEWLGGIVRGEHFVALGVTEPGSGGDAGALVSRATKVDGGWRISGEKTSVTFAPHAKAIVVLAVAQAEAGGGITAFLVPFAFDGVGQQPGTDAGWKPLGRSTVALDDVFVPDHYRLGPVGGGFGIVLREIDYARSMLGLMATGVARRALDMAIDYSKRREAFGKYIAQFQGVSFPIAEAATELDASRFLAYRSLSLADLGRPFTKEAAMAKYKGVEESLEAIRQAIVVFGHHGFAEDLPLQAMLRDVSGLQLGEGTPQIQKLVIARSIFGREFSV